MEACAEARARVKENGMLKLFLMLTFALAGAGILPFATTAQDTRMGCAEAANESVEATSRAVETHCRAERGCAGAECAASPLGDYILGKITPEFVAVYEECVAGAKIVTGMDENELAALAAELGVTPRKAVALIILRDLMGRTTKAPPLTVFAEMGDFELMKTAKRCAKAYAETLTEEERKELKTRFKAVF